MQLYLHDVVKIDIDEGSLIAEDLSFVRHMTFYNSDNKIVGNVTVFSPYDKKYITVKHGNSD